MKLSLASSLATALLVLAFPIFSSGQKAEKELTFEEQWEIVATNQKLGVIQRLERLIRPEGTKIAIYFQFDDARQKKMEALLDSALDEAGDDYVKACRKMVDSLDGEKRKTAMDRGMLSNYLPGAPDYRKFDPSKRPTWQEGLEKVLTEEETTDWQDRKQRLKEDNFKLLASQLIVLIERDIYLSSDQREELIPLMANLMKKDANLQRIQGWSSVNARSFAQFLKNQNHISEISAKLNKVQKAQFSEWARLLNGYSDKLGVTTPKRREGESVETHQERIIAEVVHANKVKDMESRLRVFLGRVAHLEKEIGLTSSQKSEMELALKGMAELMYDTHLSNVESTTRRWVKSVKDGNYNRYLQNQRVQRCLLNPDESIWEDTSHRVLTEPQQKILSALTREKKDFEAETALATLRLKSEQLLHLREEQWEALSPHIEEAIAATVPLYDQHMTSIPEPWFFNYYRALFPLTHVPEDTLQNVLTKSQWFVWTAGIKSKLDNGPMQGFAQQIKLQEAERQKIQERR